MEKRVIFRSNWLPWALLAPQLIVVGVFRVMAGFDVKPATGWGWTRTRSS